MTRTHDDSYAPRRGRGRRDDGIAPADDSGDEPYYGRGSGPPSTVASNVPPPPMGDALHQRPSSMKREGSRSRVPHLQPQFTEDSGYLGNNPPDLESKKGRRHREFRDKRDGYESDEGEMLKEAKRSGRRGGREERGMPAPYDDRDRKRRSHGDGADRRRRRDRDRDDDDRDDRRGPRDRDRRRGKDNLEVEYGSDPIPVKSSRSERKPYRPKAPERDDEDLFSSDEDRPPRRRRHRSADDHRRRRRDDEYDDDRSDHGRRSDRDRDRDRQRRDRSRRRYDSDDESDDTRRPSRRDRRRSRDRGATKKIEIGGYDVGPWIEKGSKYWPMLAPIVMNAAKKKFSGK